MIRTFKVLGLALVAVLALSAVGASGAQALKIGATGPTWLTFDALNTQEFTTPGGVTVKCTGIGGHATVENNQTEVTATSISYSGCTTNITGTVATVTMEGCDYFFHGGETDPEDPNHGIEGEVNLVCPEGKSAVIDVYASAAKHTAGETLCKFKIPGFTGHREITYTNTTGSRNDFDMKAVEVPVAYTREGSILCGAASATGHYHGEITVTGFKDEGSSGGNPVEGRRTGVAVGELEEETQLKIGATGPTWLTFDALNTQEFTTPGGTIVTCTGVGGHATVTNGQTEVTATSISYSGCTTNIAGTVATVTMNGCDYLFHGGETDPNEIGHGIEGEVDLVCPEGKSVVIDVYASAAKHSAGETLCKLNVSGFTNHKEITYTNTTGSRNDFDMKAVEVPVAYTREGSILCGAASATGHYHGEITVTGFKDEGSSGGNPVEGESTGVAIS